MILPRNEKFNIEHNMRRVIHVQKNEKKRKNDVRGICY